MYTVLHESNCKSKVYVAVVGKNVSMMHHFIKLNLKKNAERHFSLLLEYYMKGSARLCVLFILNFS